MMKAILYALMALMLIASVTAFKVETMSYEVDSTNMGLAGSDLNTWNYTGRMLWEPFYPGAEAYSNLYFMHSGYFETFFIAPEIGISLVYPGMNSVINDVNITFTDYVSSNGTVYSCNLLIWYNGFNLTVNDTVSYPSTGYHNWSGYPLPEDDYYWQVQCKNLALEEFASVLGNFSVDRTAPVVSVVQPLNDSVPYTQFDFVIDELHPAYLVINVNGSEYNFSYVNGSNTFVPSLPNGYFSWNVTVYDAAGNSYSTGPYNIYVNNAVVSIANVKFNPAIPIDTQDNTLSAVINGGFSNVTVSVQVNNGSWINYSVNTYSGSGPYTYFQPIDESLYEFLDVIRQQWFVLDNLSIWQVSGVYNATVQKASSGGSYPEAGSAAGPGNLTIMPTPLQVRTLDGILFDVFNNRSIDCELLTVRVEDTIGGEPIRDRFKVQSLSLGQNFTISPGKSLTLQLKPTGFQGIAGTGRVIVESRQCGTVEVPLGVEIYFTDIVIDTINEWTSNIIDWVEGLLARV